MACSAWRRLSSAGLVAVALVVGASLVPVATAEAQARQWLDAGALFVAVGVDTMLLSAAASELLARFKGPAGAARNSY